MRLMEGMNVTSHPLVDDHPTSQSNAKDTFLQEAETYMTFKLTKYIVKYWFPVLVPLGLVGNTLSFLVMIRPNNKNISTCIYMAAISVNDNFMLSFALYDWFIVGLKMRGWYLIECKINAYSPNFSLQCTTYLVLTMTIDKYIAIKWPHRAATYSTPKRAKVIIFSVISSAAMYNVPHFFTTAVVEGNCYGYSVEGRFTKVYSWLTIIINAVVPFTLLINMNYVIVKTVRNSRTMFINNVGTVGIDSRQKTMKTAENQLTTMLLLVTTLFLILLLPTYVRFIYAAFVISDTPSKFATSIFFSEISFKLYVTNSGVNFFLYCVSGKKFRNDLREIVCCIKKTNFTSKESCTDANTLTIAS